MAAYDAIVIGGGSGGNACAFALAAGGKNVAVVERERVGGECAFWACVPSKVLLRSASPNAQSDHVPGSKEARSGGPAFSPAAAWRTSTVNDYRDSDHARDLADAGVTLIRGAATIVGPGRVRVGDDEHTANDLVVATGSEDTVPPIEGLTSKPYWTSRDATSADEAPDSLIFLGGGAVGVELSLAFARYGTRVTIIEASDQLLPGEDPGVGTLIAKFLEDAGVALCLGTSATKAVWHDGGVTISVSSGIELSATQLCVVTGRTMRVHGFGIENAGVTIDDGCIRIDDRCNAADGVYAVGDVTGKALFTHVAKYQGRVAAANILGSDARATYNAVPRCIYTTPEIAAVGMTRKEAAEQKIELKTAHVDFDEITRPVLHSDPPAIGALELFADASTQKIVGGWMVGPSASETIGFITSAIVTKASITDLLDVIQPYPTFSESLYVALDRLNRALTPP